MSTSETQNHERERQYRADVLSAEKGEKATMILLTLESLSARDILPPSPSRPRGIDHVTGQVEVRRDDAVRPLFCVYFSVAVLIDLSTPPVSRRKSSTDLRKSGTLSTFFQFASYSFALNRERRVLGEHRDDWLAEQLCSSGFA